MKHYSSASIEKRNVFIPFLYKSNETQSVCYIILGLAIQPTVSPSNSSNLVQKTKNEAVKFGGVKLRLRMQWNKAWEELISPRFHPVPKGLSWQLRFEYQGLSLVFFHATEATMEINPCSSIPAL